ncbi:MAG: metallopeptidase family protein [bacterium]|nr:metallopeptidase family protein [bacterium]
MDRDQFESAITEALDQMPMQFAELMENVVIQVHESPTREMVENVGLDPRQSTLFGLYTGVPLDRRGAYYGSVLPDVILLFRRPLLAACHTHPQLVRQIQLTLLHEIGHHFGFSEEEMEAWEREFEGLESDVN